MPRAKNCLRDIFVHKLIEGEKFVSLTELLFASIRLAISARAVHKVTSNSVHRASEAYIHVLNELTGMEWRQTSCSRVFFFN